MREIQAEYVDAGNEKRLEDICRSAGRTDGRNDFGVPHSVSGDYVILDGSTSAFVMRMASASASASFNVSSV
jgi:hypothetical protein